MKAKSTLLTCCIIFMAFSDISAQIVASFSIDKSTGCSPLSVEFTNSSTGPGTLTYTWSFGNGNSSDLQNPKAVYSTSGTYIVRLTVSNGSETKWIEKNIEVFKNPVANFSANAKGCVPINIAFTDVSEKGNANINKWNWDFRNGVLKTEQNPSILYNNPGNYDVFLEVIDANGCKSSIEKKSFVDVVEKPTISFMLPLPIHVQFRLIFCLQTNRQEEEHSHTYGILEAE
ncbi:MAG: PKD domain-containing protein [Bacteroidales bacterium]|nr:PKD domain-containing protein [Bacteroidales bacterium]